MTAPLTLALGGPDITAFSISPTESITPLAGGALPTGTTITVTFNPTAEKAHTATITHSGAGLTNNVTLMLTGEGVATGKTPTLTLQTGTPAQPITELDFENLRIDATPTTQEYTLAGDKPYR